MAIIDYKVFSIILIIVSIGGVVWGYYIAKDLDTTSIDEFKIFSEMNYAVDQVTDCNSTLPSNKHSIIPNTMSGDFVPTIYSGGNYGDKNIELQNRNPL